jgi:hypothetical protein
LRIARLQAQGDYVWFEALREWLQLEGEREGERTAPAAVRRKLREFVPEYSVGSSVSASTA